MFQLPSRDIVQCVTAVSKGQCVNFIHAKNQRRRRFKYNITFRCVRANHCCSEKTVRNTNCECIFLTVIFNLIMLKFYLFFCQVSSMKCAHAVLICLVACPAVHYFSTLSHKWRGFGNKGTEHTMCILIFPTTFA